MSRAIANARRIARLFGSRQIDRSDESRLTRGLSAHSAAESRLDFLGEQANVAPRTRRSPRQQTDHSLTSGTAAWCPISAGQFGTNTSDIWCRPSAEPPVSNSSLYLVRPKTRQGPADHLRDVRLTKQRVSLAEASRNYREFSPISRLPALWNPGTSRLAQSVKSCCGRRASSRRYMSPPPKPHFPDPSLDRRRIACLYQDPPIIWAKHFTHLINSLHGALHLYACRYQDVTSNTKRPSMLAELGRLSIPPRLSSDNRIAGCAVRDRKRIRPPFRSLKTARSQHITRSKASTSGRMGIGRTRPADCTIACEVGA